ncbi:MAG: cystatin domain-containing protein [Novosphingobium sp.]|uniref:cystatin family protein n=1 Tax=Novosphingobium sp. TaxID=1874826 RepID=UPI0032BDE58B
MAVRLVTIGAFALAMLAAPLGAQLQATDAAGKAAVHDDSIANQGEFGVMQFATTDPQAMWDAWAQATAGVEIQTHRTTARNQPIFTFIAFRGCKVDAKGACHLAARFEVFDPSGKSYAVTEGAALIDGRPPPPGNIGMGRASLGIRVEAGEPLGPYKVIVRTTDTVAGITLTTQSILTIVEAPSVGGWQPVPNPNADQALRKLAIRALPKISRKKPRLAKIERAESQVVAGTNYRLVVRLRDGTRWIMKIWHKLDGTIEVSELAQLI